MLKSITVCDAVEAEIRRVADYHSRECVRWEEKVHKNFINRPEYYKGANGYALRQASFHRSLQEGYTRVWEVVRRVMDEHHENRYDTSLRSSEPSDSLASPTLADTASGDYGVVDNRGQIGLETL